MRRALIVLLMMAFMVLGSGARSAMAVPLHQHGITTPSGHVALPAQGFCQNPVVFAEGTAAHRALHNFHFHVHLGDPPIGLAHFC
jgi:hypothetical protein